MRPVNSNSMPLSPSETFYCRYGKRWLDALAAAVSLLFLAPVFAILAVAIRLESTGPCFFRQVRTGRNGVPFRIFKFRSMRQSDPGSAPLITASGDPRITKMGRWLRNTKMDELPQLINVLQGDMSLVGPRPEVPKYTNLYTAAQRKVLVMRPGITGPAAMACVNEEELLARQSDPEEFYRESLMPAKLQLDLSYCRDIRLSRDLKLIVLTLGKMFFRNRSPLANLAALPGNTEDFQP